MLYELRTPPRLREGALPRRAAAAARFEILQPARGSATSEVLEWRLSEDLTRRASATTVGVEIWLDGTRLLEQNLTMPRAGKTEAGDLASKPQVWATSRWAPFTVVCKRASATARWASKTSPWSWLRRDGLRSLLEPCETNINSLSSSS